MAAVVAALSVVVVLLTLVVVSLLRSHAEILRTLHDAGLGGPGAPAGADRRRELGTSGAPPGHLMSQAGAAVGPWREDEGRALGAEVTDIVGVTPGGDAVSISLTTTPLTLVAFLSSGCLSCRDLWDAVDTDGQAAARSMGARLVVTTLGADEESPARVAELAGATVTTILSSEAWEAFGVPASPYFALVDGRGGRVVGEGSGHSWPQVQRLLAQASADATLEPPGPKVDRRSFLTGRERSRRADRALLDAGIEPGDPSLTPSTITDRPDGDTPDGATPHG